MGYIIDNLEFYAISTNTSYPIAVPTEADKNELINFIISFKNFDPTKPFKVNTNKCIHCIYCNLCDKTVTENVYT